MYNFCHFWDNSTIMKKTFIIFVVLLCLWSLASCKKESITAEEKLTLLSSPTFQAYESNEVEYVSFFAELIKKLRGGK